MIVGDARETLPRWTGTADAWFLDGFSPLPRTPRDVGTRIDDASRCAHRPPRRNRCQLYRRRIRAARAERGGVRCQASRRIWPQAPYDSRHHARNALTNGAAEHAPRHSIDGRDHLRFLDAGWYFAPSRGRIQRVDGRNDPLLVFRRLCCRRRQPQGRWGLVPRPPPPNRLFRSCAAHFSRLKSALWFWPSPCWGLIESHAVFTCYPLLVAALSGPVLGEHVGWRRWVAIGIGFIGVLIILQPGVRRVFTLCTGPARRRADVCALRPAYPLCRPTRFCRHIIFLDGRCRSSAAYPAGPLVLGADDRP